MLADCNFVFVIKLSGNFSLASSLYLRFPLDLRCRCVVRIQVNLSEYDYNGAVDVKIRIMTCLQQNVLTKVPNNVWRSCFVTSAAGDWTIPKQILHSIQRSFNQKTKLDNLEKKFARLTRRAGFMIAKLPNLEN